MLGYTLAFAKKVFMATCIHVLDSVHIIFVCIFEVIIVST